MTPKTIRHYVRYTDIPYDTIIDRAINSGWRVLDDWIGYSKSEDKTVRQVTIINDKNEYYSTMYPIDEPKTAIYNQFAFDRGR
jgi:chromosome condensin MukBEF complex kleisin-like MukF subunit